MRNYPKFSDQLIVDAFAEIGKIDDLPTRETALASVLKVLVHGEPEVVRAHLCSITDEWHRYELLVELYGAHGNECDLTQLKRIKRNDSFPDLKDLKEQIAMLRIRIAADWRSQPESCIVTSEFRDRMLSRSIARLRSFRFHGGPSIFIFYELCLRISLGDVKVIGEARAMAGDDVEMRDRIVTAVAKGHAHNASSHRARKALVHVCLPENRIEVMMALASVESELGIQATVTTMQH